MLYSCDQYYFTTPQPVDSENVYKFPADYRGIWVEEGDTILFEKDYFVNITYTNRKVAKNMADTSSQYIIKDEKIFVVDEEEEVEIKGGFLYTLKDDTLYFREREMLEVILG